MKSQMTVQSFPEKRMIQGLTWDEVPVGSFYRRNGHLSLKLSNKESLSVGPSPSFGAMIKLAPGKKEGRYDQDRHVVNVVIVAGE